MLGAECYMLGASFNAVLSSLVSSRRLQTVFVVVTISIVRSTSAQGKCLKIIHFCRKSPEPGPQHQHDSLAAPQSKPTTLSGIPDMNTLWQRIAHLGIMERQ